MRVEIVGGGPSGLYLAILLREAEAGFEVTVHERNRPEDAYGFGVVFSDETTAGLEAAEPKSFGQISAGFRRWDDI